MQINRNSAISQLTTLGYSQGEEVYLRALPSDGSKSGAVSLNAKFPDLPWKKIEYLQTQGKGIYIVVNGGGQDKSSVKVGRAIFYEHDFLDKDIQLSLWQTLGLPEPTIQIDTGGKSIHTYWVFDKPCSVEEWIALQADLLEFADADRSIKDPPRLMRLAGCWHINTSNQSFIASHSNIKYSYAQMRKAIPAKQSEPQYSTRDASYTTPASSNDVPIENCLTLSDRALIESGVGEGERNVQGAKLARNLIGTAKYLGRSELEARSLFDYFCSRCSPPLDAKEGEQIWKSANKNNPSPSLSPDIIENCIAAWQRKEDRKEHWQGSSTSGKRQASVDDQPSDSQSLYKDFLNRVESLLQYKDADEYKFHRSKLARNFSYRTEDIDDLIRRKLMPEDKKERRIYDLAELRDMPQFALEWLIPGFLPRGESLLFSAEAKMGKTLLSDDLIFHIITGEDDFLGVGAQTKTGRVLKISVDESVQSTVLKAEKRYGPTWLESNRVRLVTDWKLTEQDFLETQIDEFNPDLVVIDSLRQVAANIGISENSAEFVDAIASVIKLCRRKNVSLVVIHHDNKNKESQGIDRARGSSSLPAAFWGILRLDPFPIAVEEGEGKQKKQTIKFDPQDTRRLLNLTARDVASQRLQIDLELENHHWLNKGEIGEDDAHSRADFEQRILNMLKIHNRPLSTADLLDIMEVDATQKRTLYRAIEKLVAKRLINKVAAAVVVPREKGRPTWHYSLPSSPPPSPSPTDPDLSLNTPLSQNQAGIVSTSDTENAVFNDKEAFNDNKVSPDTGRGGENQVASRKSQVATEEEETVATALPEIGQRVTINSGSKTFDGLTGIVYFYDHQPDGIYCEIRVDPSDRYQGGTLSYKPECLTW